MQSAVLMVQCSKSKKQWYIHPSILHLRLYPFHSIPSHHPPHNPQSQPLHLPTLPPSIHTQHIPRHALQLVPLRRLQTLKLRVHHIILHIVALTTPHAVHEHRLAGLQEDKVYFEVWAPVGGDAEDVAVFAFEG